MRALWLVVVYSLCWASCATTREPPPATAPPNIVLITVDTLRADHLGCYGHPERLTPELDALAARGILFEQAVTPAPLTLPAHASLLTGTLPLHHGVRDNTGFVLGADHVTLAEALQDAGYQTGAFVGAFVLDSRFGLDQGFDTYFDDFPESLDDHAQLTISERRADAVIAQAEAWIRARSSQRRFFAWLHLFDPHAPYEPPPPLRGYAGEVAYVDRVLGAFFRFLEEEGHLGRTAIAFTSDHGEGLGEHGEDTHGMFLYDTTLHVPLILALPAASSRGVRVPHQVELIDVMPTLLEQAGLEAPAAVQGVSLREAWESEGFRERPAYAEAMLPLLNYGWSDLSALRTRQYKYVRAPQPELYDLASDPRETANLWSVRQDQARDLSAQLEALKREANSSSAAARRAPDSETLARLRSLGYAGSSRPPSIEEGTRADPKERIDLFNRIWRAQGAAQRGRHEEAIGLLNAVLEEDPGVFIAHSIRSLALLELGRPREALSSLRKAVQLRPEDPGAHLYLGIAQQRTGRLAEATASFQTAWRLDRSLSAARNNLAAVLGQQQRYREAAEIFEKMVRESPGDLAARLNLAQSYLLEGRAADARPHLEYVLARREDLPELHNALGMLYFELQRPEDSERHLLRALGLRPSYPAAHANLARLYRRQGRLEDSRTHQRLAERGGTD